MSKANGPTLMPDEEKPTYQAEAESLSFLKKVPLFASLAEEDILGLSQELKVVKISRGQEVCREGEPGDSLYIIRSGIVIVSTQENGEAKIVNQLHRGDFFGEVSLLTGEPRSATVEALLDVELFVLSKTSFENIIRDKPLVSVHLNRILSHRLQQSLSTNQLAVSPCFYSIIGSQKGLGSSVFIENIAAILALEVKRRVLIVALNEGGIRGQVAGLSTAPVPDQQLLEDVPLPYRDLLSNCWFDCPSGFTMFSFPSPRDKKLLAIIRSNLSFVLGIVRRRFDYVLFDLAPALNPISKRVLRLSDKVLFLSTTTSEGVSLAKKKLHEIKTIVGQDPSTVSVGVSYLIGDSGLHRPLIREILEIPEVPDVWVSRRDQKTEQERKAVYPRKMTGARKVAREIGGIRIGLALGSGGAKGWAHVGVLEALEKENITIDMITGTSIGALVGATYAKTSSAEDTYRLTIGKFPDKRSARKNVFDYTIPFKGFIKGNKILQMLEEGLENADFLDLTIPLAVTAVDINNGEVVILDNGPVAEAVRASIAIPGVIAPVNLGGRWLVDGALLNPVPADILIRKGINFVIGVFLENKQSKTGWDAERGPSIVQVLTRSFGIISSQASQGIPDLVNIAIHPRVDGFRWDDFHRGEDLVKIGREAGYEVIEKIKQLTS
ncbi:MAG: patatin-like phospholipase family protein [Thermodesulfobacteriota bacterium]|nr:patatin-like phospholipase family protein [Thermodesulfobacteriota bacterium]